MTMQTQGVRTLNREPELLTARRARSLSALGGGVLRYGLVFLLVVIGSFKFFEFEAEGIQPLLQHSPFLSWLLVFGTRGASSFIGVIELATGLCIAARRWAPRLSGYGSLAASFTFLVTLSFLLSTPGALLPGDATGSFLVKDIILLGAALWTAGEALSASLPSKAVG